MIFASLSISLIIVFWLFLVFLGICIIGKHIFNVNICSKKFRKGLCKRLLEIINLYQFKNTYIKSPLFHLICYTVLLSIVAFISDYISPDDPIPRWISYIIILLGILVMIIIILDLIIIIIKYLFIEPIKTIPEEVKSLKQQKRPYNGFMIFIYAFLIMIIPAIVFGFIYSIVQFFNDFLHSGELNNLFSKKYFVYSFSISFSVSKEDTESINFFGSHFLSILQVIIQRIVEIGVLGYIVNIISEVLKHSEQTKKINH